MKKQIIYTYDELKALQKQCGTYAIAKHMANKGYSLNNALYVLTKQK